MARAGGRIVHVDSSTMSGAEDMYMVLYIAQTFGGSSDESLGGCWQGGSEEGRSRERR